MLTSNIGPRQYMAQIITCAVVQPHAVDKWVRNPPLMVHGEELPQVDCTNGCHPLLLGVLVSQNL
jgi:hypothetical protein